MTNATIFDAPLAAAEDIVEGMGDQLVVSLAVVAALVGSMLGFNAVQFMGAVGVDIAAAS